MKSSMNLYIFCRERDAPHARKALHARKAPHSRSWDDKKSSIADILELDKKCYENKGCRYAVSSAKSRHPS